MRRYAITGLMIALVAQGAKIQAQDTPELPAPQEEHQWLQQFVGEWETDAECVFEPGQPPVKCTGTESARMLGGFWMISSSQSEIAGMSIKANLTLGYDTDKKQYVGTWIDSMTDYLWKYEGSVDKSGKVLTLLTEGPCHLTPGRHANFKEVIEFKSKDHRVFTSSVQGEDGKWTTMVTVNARRKQ